MQKFHRLYTLASLLLVVFFIPISSAHHAGGHPTRYVAERGVDDGSCMNPKKPCKSIIYAFTQSGKGDKIRVAEGSYRIEESEIFLLLSDMIIVRGSYSTEDNFRKAKKNQLVSYLVGVPLEYREQLAKTGFKVIADRKGQYNLDSSTRQELSVYQNIRSNNQPASVCVNGKAGQFPCNNIDLKAHIPNASFSSKPASANDIWGFVDLNNNREYAILGLSNGTAIIDVTDPVTPKEIGTIPGSTSIWRDVKVYQYLDSATQTYKAYAYVTVESNQGMQVIDLTNLPESVSLANTLQDFSSAHNVYIANVNYATGVSNENIPPALYIAGANKNNGAYRILGLTDPLNPSLDLAPPSGTGYMHDATSLVINDSRTAQCSEGHNPCELLVDFNESTVDIWDVTDKSKPVKLSETSYNNTGYTHSGWWSEDKKHIFIQDETDEIQHGINTTLRVMEISNLAQPTIVGEYVGPTPSSDHNGFTVGQRYYMSNYNRGLSVLDVSVPSTPKEIGYFDTYPAPAANKAENQGAWGTYPYLPSGNILISDYTYGFFVVSMQTGSSQAPPVITSASALSVDEDNSLALSLSHLTVTDSTNKYPTGFSLEVFAGSNYSVNNQAITPNSQFNGVLSVPVRVNDGVNNSNTFNLTITVKPVNDAPVATNDSYSFAQNSSTTTLSVLNNDSDIDGDQLSIESFNYTGNSTVVNNNTSLSYTPANGFNGNETIQYTVSDGKGLTSTASISITITAQSSGGNSGGGNSNGGNSGGGASSSGGGSLNFNLLLLLIVSLLFNQKRMTQKYFSIKKQ